jgi:hypothetical protein
MQVFVIALAERETTTGGWGEKGEGGGGRRERGYLKVISLFRQDDGCELFCGCARTCVAVSQHVELQHVGVGG